MVLLDGSTAPEETLLRNWIAATKPADAHVEVYRLKQRSNHGAVSPRLAARVDTATDDPLFLPLRIAWMAPERHHGRAPRLRDLLTVGDPRDPGPLRQRLILHSRPDRARVVVAAPARLSEMRTAWQSPDGPDPHGIPLPEFVALRAALALERAERRVRGSRYKVPRFLERDLLSRRRLTREMSRLAAATGEAMEETSRRVRTGLREIAATHSPYVIDLVANATRILLEPSYGTRIRYSKDELAAICKTGSDRPLVFLPSHKSNLDHLVLHYLLYENDLPPTHTAGGINLNFFPVGPIVRRAGVFFIRRTFKDDEAYKLTLRAYLRYLLGKRFSLEWYVEGGRSRSGKLREPRYGLLSYVVDAWKEGAVDDVMLVPVSIAYDQIQDVGAYAAEQAGVPKARESIRELVSFISKLRRRWGAIHVRFGRPLSLADDMPDDVPKLAFEVATRINEVTPVTPISLVTMALLAAGDRSLTLSETVTAVEPYLEFTQRRSLPVTSATDLNTPRGVQAALDALVEHRVVSRYAGGREVVYGISSQQHLAASYYRNTVIHFFVESAITELAMVAAAQSDRSDKVRTFIDEALQLRDLLKFEFFFAPRSRFVRRITEEFGLKDPQWERHLADRDLAAMVASFRPFTSHVVLLPFLEAYGIVADALVAMGSDTVDEADLMSSAFDLGRQLVLQRRIRSREAVSKEMFHTGVRLAAHRDLLTGAAEVEEARHAHRRVVASWLRRIAAVDALEAGRAAGILEAVEKTVDYSP